MGMVKCKECGKEISSKAESCPNCGVKRENKPFFTVKGFILLLIFITVFTIVRSPNLDESTEAKSTPIKPVLTEQQKHNKEKIIVQKLKKIPASEIYTNLSMYKELQKLFPLNKKYSKKVEYYTQKVSKLENKIGKKPSVNPWDNVPYTVERYIKSIAKDPDSVKFDGCTELRFSNNGWVTSCKVRAKNSFGGYVLNIYKFTISNNTVIEAKNIN